MLMLRRVLSPARGMLLAGLGLGLATGLAWAQEAQRLGAEPLTLPVKLVDGHLIVALTVHNAAGQADAISVELALDNPDVLTLHGNQLGWTGVDPAAKDSTARVKFANGTTLLLPGRDLKVEPSNERVEEHDRLTRFFSSQLEERKLKGSLGLGFLKPYDVVLDLTERQLVLTPPGGADAPEKDDTATGDFVGIFELREGRITLPIESPAGPSGRMILGSSTYDTLIDPAVARRLGKPAGDVAPVTLVGTGELELSRHVPFRPQAWRTGPAPAAAAAAEAPLLLSGVNLLQAFRLEIDWATSRVRFTQLKVPATSPADRAYFEAQVAGTAEAYQSFLEANPGSRFGAEAAKRLIELRFNDPLGLDVAVLAALQWVIDTSPPDRRTENCLTYVNRLAELEGQAELAIQAALLALKYSRQAVTVQHVYRLHRLIGEKYLEQDNLPSAWKHLLSAAFVPIARDPEHAFRVALNLARVYERQERHGRAYSRYKAALAVAGAPITAELRAEITAALQRLRAKIPAEQLQLLDS
jgi:hypothetical protein